MKTKGRIKRLLAIMLLMTVALIGTARVAEAAPYGTTTVSVGVSVSTNPQGQTVLTITITNGEANTTYTIILHSTPVTLGTLTTDASGNASGAFTAPAGFTGAHLVEVVSSSGSSAGSSAGTSAVTLPAAGAGSGSSTGGGSNLAFTGVAVIGLGVLAVGLLGAGGVLLFMGRRRVERAS